MKSIVEKHLRQISKDDITFEDEFAQINRDLKTDPEFLSIGIEISDKDERLKNDKRFAELAEL